MKLRDKGELTLRESMQKAEEALRRKAEGGEEERRLGDEGSS
jgi:hypothetical protein